MENQQNQYYPKTNAYEAFQRISPHVGLHAQRITQHPRHDVLPEDQNLLVEELDAGRVGSKVDLGYLGPEFTCQGRKQRTLW